jgi:hypothetical protein
VKVWRRRRRADLPEVFIFDNPPSVFERLHQTVFDDDPPFGFPAFKNPRTDPMANVWVHADSEQFEMPVREPTEAVVLRLEHGDHRIVVRSPAHAEIHLLRILGSGPDTTRLELTLDCPTQRIVLHDLELVNCCSTPERSWPTTEIALGDVKVTNSVVTVVTGPTRTRLRGPASSRCQSTPRSPSNA